MAIHAFMWSWSKTCGKLDAIPSVTIGSCKSKTVNEFNMTLTVLNLHQKTPKGATTKIQVKRYMRDIRDKIVSDIPIQRDKIASDSDMQDQRSNLGHTMTLQTYNPRPMSQISTSYTLWFPKYSSDKAL